MFLCISWVLITMVFRNTAVFRVAQPAEVILGQYEGFS